MKKTFILTILLALASFTTYGKEEIELAKDISVTLDQQASVSEALPVQTEVQSKASVSNVETIDVDLTKIDATSLVNSINAIIASKEKASVTEHLIVNIIGFDKLSSQDALNILIQALVAVSENKNLTVVIDKADELDSSSYTSVQISSLMALTAKKALENLKWYEMKDVTDPGTGLWALAMRAQKKAKRNESIDTEYKLFIRMLADINELDIKTNTITQTTIKE